jgi:hypothetical protein
MTPAGRLAGNSLLGGRCGNVEGRTPSCGDLGSGKGSFGGTLQLSVAVGKDASLHEAKGVGTKEMLSLELIPVWTGKYIGGDHEHP